MRQLIPPFCHPQALRKPNSSLGRPTRRAKDDGCDPCDTAPATAGVPRHRTQHSMPRLFTDADDAERSLIANQERSRFRRVRSTIARPVDATTHIEHVDVGAATEARTYVIAASTMAMSCSVVPPLTPTPAMTWPSLVSGTPPPIAEYLPPETARRGYRAAPGWGLSETLCEWRGLSVRG